MCVYVCICVSICVYVWAMRYTHRQTRHILTQTQTHTHTHTHRAGEREETRRDETHRQVDILAQATGINNSHFVTSCHSVP
jgi:Ca2+/H+ antiporter